MDISQLPPQLRSLVNAEIESGERVTWIDQPIPGRMARATLPAVLFGIPWTAFAIFWTAGAAWGTSKTHDAGFFRLFPLFGVPFILVGFGMLSSPYWARRAARRSVYVLTDRRAIVISGGLRGTVTVRSFERERLNDLRRKQNKDGSGDLIFSQDITRDNDGDRRFTSIGFLAVRNVKEVEDKVRTLAKHFASAV